MGQEAAATLRVNGKRYRGRALLEHDALIFRGERRLTIPFTEVRAVEARSGALRVTAGRRVATFQLGDAALRWAERIRFPRSLADKLGITPGSRVAVLGVEDQAFWTQLRARTREISMARPRPGTDLIFVQVRTPRDLAP